jgi:hypothetical protein
VQLIKLEETEDLLPPEGLVQGDKGAPQRQLGSRRLRPLRAQEGHKVLRRVVGRLGAPVAVEDACSRSKACSLDALRC